jgi:PAS domain S-box-containing protein
MILRRVFSLETISDKLRIMIFSSLSARSLWLRLLAPVLGVVILLTFGLHHVFTQSREEFTAKQTGLTLQRHIKDIAALADRRNEEPCPAGLPGELGPEAAAKRLALGDIEAYLANRGQGGLVYNGVTQEILLARDLPPGMKNQSLIAHAWDKDRVVFFESGGKRFIASHGEYAPWSWQIITFVSPVASGDPERTQVFAVSVLAGLVLTALLYVSVKHPLNSIVAQLRADRPPAYRGCGEFTELSLAIEAVMASAREKTEWTESLFATIGAIIIVMDKELRITSVNAAAQRLVGVDSGDLLGRHLWEGVTPEANMSQIRGVFYKLLKERIPVTFESPVISREFGTIDVLWTCAAGLGEDGEAKWIIATGLDIHELNHALGEIRTLNEGLEGRVEARTRQLSIANQELLDTLETLRKTQFRLVQAESMAALGGLVAGMTHEINTPVGVGVTAASHLEEKTRQFRRRFAEGGAKRADLEDYLNLSDEAARIVLVNLRRAAELIGTFKKVAVDQCSADRRVIKPFEYIQEVLLSLRPRLKKTNHAIAVEVDPELVLDTYPGAFSQVVTNLLMNSLQHAFTDQQAGSIVFSLKPTAAGYRFVYSDNGRGIERANLERIFEPFFTTAKDRGGTGLGMHIVQHLAVETLGGSIKCESAPGEGARFIIDLPSSPPEQER